MDATTAAPIEKECPPIDTPSTDSLIPPSSSTSTEPPTLLLSTSNLEHECSGQKHPETCVGENDCLCVICLDRQRSVCLPCGHANICSYCLLSNLIVRHSNLCPTCRAPFSRYVVNSSLCSGPAFHEDLSPEAFAQLGRLFVAPSITAFHHPVILTMPSSEVPTPTRMTVRSLPCCQAFAVLCAIGLSWLILLLLLVVGIGGIAIGAEFMNAKCKQPVAKWLLWYGSLNSACALWLKSLLFARVRVTARLRVPSRKQSSPILIFLWVVLTLVGCVYVFRTDEQHCHRVLFRYGLYSLIVTFLAIMVYFPTMCVLLLQPAVWHYIQPVPSAIMSLRNLLQTPLHRQSHQQSQHQQSQIIRHAYAGPPV